MKIINPDKWFPSDNIVLEDNADKVVRSNANVLVIAGPGAGKTELLAQKASYLFQTNICEDPQKILAISFKKDAAENLKKRVIKRCGDDIKSRFVSMTYDAFSKSILDHFRFALPVILRPKADYQINDDNIISAAFEKSGYCNPYSFSPSKLKKFYYHTINSVTLPFSNNSLGEKVWSLLLNGFDNYKSTLTFSMISILAEYIIRTNPKIKRCLQLTYKYVFLDEFQDTTDLQYSLVKQSFLNSSTIMTAVGDTKQRIMVWAGARKTVFEDYINEFQSEIYYLTMNHRSAPRLVNLQRAMYGSLKEIHIDTQVSDKWNTDDGIITLIKAENESQEANVIANQIFKHISSGVEPNKLCIICKQTPEKYANLIISKLSDYNIRARIENEYQDLLNEPIVEFMIGLFHLAIDRKRPQDWTFIVSLLSDLWNVYSLQSDEDYFQMLRSIENEIIRINKTIDKVNNKRDLHQLLEQIMNYLGWKKIRAFFPAYQGRYLNDTLTKFQDLFWNELVTTHLNWSLSLEDFMGIHSVPIMTIHKSKGLEFESVYFVGIEDSAFWSFKYQPEEDRCAFFVALSRAKKEIVFSYCDYRASLQYPKQSHNDINEFFDLLTTPGIATIIDC